MATAVSGTGPTYVFLVMEALIDAAVHLGFPRHIAHDLVIETLEGSTLFAKQSGMHPAELRNMVTSPGGTSAAALHELESGRLRTVLSEAVWAAYPPHRRARRPARGERRPGRASHGPGADDGRRRRSRRVATTISPDLRRAPLADLSAVDLRAPDRDLWADEAALWDRLTDVWAGLDDAAWHLPGAAPSDAGGPDWSLAEHVGHIADWQELGRGVHGRCHRRPGEWPSDDDYDGGDFDRYNERRREPWASMPRDEVIGRLDGGATAAARSRPSPRGGDDPRVPSRGAGSATRCTATISTISRSSSRGPTSSGSARSMATRSSRTRARSTSPGSWPRTRPSRPTSTRLSGRFRLRPGRRRTSRPAGTSPITLRTSPIGRRKAPGGRGVRAARLLAVRSGRGDRRLERSDGRPLPRHGDRGDARPLRRGRVRAARGRRPPVHVDDLRSPDGWSWAYDCLHGHVRKHLAMLGPWSASQLFTGDRR